MAMAAGQLTLSEAFPGRFLLGLGVSHQPMVDLVRGHHYDKPLTKMRAYLDAMDNVFYVAPRPEEEPRRVLAALGPKMLELAAAKALGAHPYFVPVEHTAFARDVLGEGPMLVPRAGGRARHRRRGRPGRRPASTWPPTSACRTTRTTCGASGGATTTSPTAAATRLVDAIVAWGDEDAIVERVQAHLDAGADHVCVQVLDRDAAALPMPQWRALAPALGSLALTGCERAGVSR